MNRDYVYIKDNEGLKSSKGNKKLILPTSTIKVVPLT